MPTVTVEFTGSLPFTHLTTGDRSAGLEDLLDGQGRLNAME
jgi:hypothetical protein